MSDILKKCRLIGVAASAAATLAILGCGDDSGLERRYKVTGRVTYKNQPVVKGSIAFEPVDATSGRVASGYIENGSYSLTTSGSTPGDGALPGEYRVAIASSDMDTAAVAQKTGGLLHQGDAEHQKALSAAKSPIPTKYAQSSTSGLTRKVEARSNQFDFELTD
jgi:hypothetical protein